MTNPFKIIPVIHLTDESRLFKNIETCLELDVKNVFIINHISDSKDLLEKANKVRSMYSDLWIGLNFLDKEPIQSLQLDINFDALWVDKTLSFEDTKNKKFKGDIFSGLNFKYQKQLYGPFLTDAIETIKITSNVACTSGPGTGIEASIKKIEDLKEVLGDFPLALASGISSSNIRNYLPYVDTFLVASSITDRNEVINKELLKELINNI